MHASRFYKLQKLGVEIARRKFRFSGFLTQRNLSSGCGRSFPDPELVIFDKDGTLICVHTMFAPWMHQFASSVEQRTGLPIAIEVYRVLGYCHITEKLLQGVFSEGTTLQAKNILTDLLVSRGVPEKQARDILDDVWTEGDHKLHLKHLGNPQFVIKTLKANGVKIAVCTADNREGTEDVLKELKIEHDVDMIVCGNDPDSVPKPAPDNALRICRSLGVAPDRAVMIGDSKADILMSKAARLGFTVGVITGATPEKELYGYGADCVIDDIDGLLPILGYEGEQTVEQRNEPQVAA